MGQKPDFITVLGPTASGKTAFAVNLAARLDAEIISADSRQVYRRMDIGTGKDLGEYQFRDEKNNCQLSTVNCHLIDIVEPGTKYTVYNYQHDFLAAYEQIRSRGKQAVVCGGSGLYLESVLRGYRLSPVPKNEALRQSLEGKSLDELTAILASYKTLHNTTDVDNPRRAIRAIEIADYYARTPIDPRPFPALSSLIIGLNPDRETRRQRITRRLQQRLDDGMLDEIRSLLAEGIAPDDLIYYGLEYKYLTLHVLGQLTYDEMFSRLETAIHQFAKRQMTYFRGMERRGLKIHWLPLPDHQLSADEVHALLSRLEAEN